MFSFDYSTSVRVLMILTCALSLAGCAARVADPEYAPHDSSVNSLDWAGSYHGVLPCADCAGIETTLILDYDLTYRIITRYDSAGQLSCWRKPFDPA